MTSSKVQQTSGIP